MFDELSVTVSPPTTGRHSPRHNDNSVPSADNTLSVARLPHISSESAKMPQSKNIELYCQGHRLLFIILWLKMPLSRVALIRMQNTRPPPPASGLKLLRMT